MKALGATRVFAAVALFELMCFQAAWSDTPVAPALDPEAAKQIEIYQSRGQKVPEGYVIDRSLLSYAFVLPAEFTSSLASLGPEDRWLDVGAGEGRAVLDYETGQYDAILPGHRDGKA